MYKITFPNGTSAVTEKPNFIRKHTNNCFIIVYPKKDEVIPANAEGISWRGSPFLFAEGTMVHEIDGGNLVDSQQTAIDGIIKTILEG